MDEIATLKRCELYRLVWEQPMLQLAKTYGLSDVGLAKICRKHDIPRPPRGYWAKLQHGQKPARTPLPEPGRDEDVELRDHGQGIPESDALRQQITDKAAEERRPEMRIEVGESLRGSHKLVSRANQALSAASIDQYGIIITPDENTLDITTSRKSLRRALLIMDALLKGLEERGCEIEAGPTVKLLGVSIGFRLREQVETQREQPEHHDLEGPYVFGHSRFDVRRVPSGRLCLEINQSLSYRAGGCQRTWRDTEKRRLEERLNDFVTGLVTLAGRLKAHQDEQRRQAELRRQEAERQAERRRQEEARRQEVERKRAEWRKRYEAERDRIDQLMAQAERYQKSKEVRALIEAVRQLHAADGAIEPGSEVAKWIEWAQQQADRLDPLRASPPSILDEDPDDANDEEAG